MNMSQCAELARFARSTPTPRPGACSHAPHPDFAAAGAATTTRAFSGMPDVNYIEERRRDGPGGPRFLAPRPSKSMRGRAISG